MARCSPKSIQQSIGFDALRRASWDWINWWNFGLYILCIRYQIDARLICDMDGLFHCRRLKFIHFHPDWYRGIHLNLIDSIWNVENQENGPCREGQRPLTVSCLDAFGYLESEWYPCRDSQRLG